MTTPSLPLWGTTPQFSENVRQTMQLLKDGMHPRELLGTYSRIVIREAQEEIKRLAEMKNTRSDWHEY